MRESLYAYCLRSGETDLLAQWDQGGNGALTPADLSYGSKQKVWWTCEKGHRWQATVTARTSDHTGCPVCAGKVSGKNLARYHDPPPGQPIQERPR